MEDEGASSECDDLEGEAINHYADILENQLLNSPKNKPKAQEISQLAETAAPHKFKRSNTGAFDISSISGGKSLEEVDNELEAGDVEMGLPSPCLSSVSALSPMVFGHKGLPFSQEVLPQSDHEHNRVRDFYITSAEESGEENNPQKIFNFAESTNKLVPAMDKHEGERCESLPSLSQVLVLKSPQKASVSAVTTGTSANEGGSQSVKSTTSQRSSENPGPQDTGRPAQLSADALCSEGDHVKSPDKVNSDSAEAVCDTGAVAGGDQDPDTNRLCDKHQKKPQPSQGQIISGATAKNNNKVQTDTLSTAADKNTELQPPGSGTGVSRAIARNDTKAKPSQGLTNTREITLSSTKSKDSMVSELKASKSTDMCALDHQAQVVPPIMDGVTIEVPEEYTEVCEKIFNEVLHEVSSNDSDQMITQKSVMEPSGITSKAACQVNTSVSELASSDKSKNLDEFRTSIPDLKLSDSSINAAHVLASMSSSKSYKSKSLGEVLTETSPKVAGDHETSLEEEKKTTDADSQEAPEACRQGPVNQQSNDLVEGVVETLPFIEPVGRRTRSRKSSSSEPDTDLKTSSVGIEGIETLNQNKLRTTRGRKSIQRSVSEPEQDHKDSPGKNTISASSPKLETELRTQKPSTGAKENPDPCNQSDPKILESPDGENDSPESPKTDPKVCGSVEEIEGSSTLHTTSNIDDISSEKEGAFTQTIARETVKSPEFSAPLTRRVTRSRKSLESDDGELLSPPVPKRQSLRGIVEEVQLDSDGSRKLYAGTRLGRRLTRSLSQSSDASNKSLEETTSRLSKGHDGASVPAHVTRRVTRASHIPENLSKMADRGKGQTQGDLELPPRRRGRPRGQPKESGEGNNNETEKKSGGPLVVERETKDETHLRVMRSGKKVLIPNAVTSGEGTENRVTPANDDVEIASSDTSKRSEGKVKEKATESKDDCSSQDASLHSQPKEEVSMLPSDARLKGHSRKRTLSASSAEGESDRVAETADTSDVPKRRKSEDKRSRSPVVKVVEKESTCAVQGERSGSLAFKETESASVEDSVLEVEQITTDLTENISSIEQCHIKNGDSEREDNADDVIQKKKDVGLGDDDDEDDGNTAADFSLTAHDSGIESFMDVTHELYKEKECSSAQKNSSLMGTPEPIPAIPTASTEEKEKQNREQGKDQGCAYLNKDVTDNLGISASGNVSSDWSAIRGDTEAIGEDMLSTSSLISAEGRNVSTESNEIAKWEHIELTEGDGLTDNTVISSIGDRTVTLDSNAGNKMDPLESKEGTSDKNSKQDDHAVMRVSRRDSVMEDEKKSEEKSMVEENVTSGRDFRSEADQIPERGSARNEVTSEECERINSVASQSLVYYPSMKGLFSKPPPIVRVSQTAVVVVSPETSGIPVPPGGGRSRSNTPSLESEGTGSGRTSAASAISPLTALSEDGKESPISPLSISPDCTNPLSPLPGSPDMPELDPVSPLPPSPSPRRGSASLVSTPQRGVHRSAVGSRRSAEVPTPVSPLPNTPMPPILSPLTSSTKSTPCMFHAEAPKTAVQVKPQRIQATRRSLGKEFENGEGAHKEEQPQQREVMETVTQGMISSQAAALQILHNQHTATEKAAHDKPKSSFRKQAKREESQTKCAATKNPTTTSKDHSHKKRRLSNTEESSTNKVPVSDMQTTNQSTVSESTAIPKPLISDSRCDLRNKLKTQTAQFFKPGPVQKRILSGKGGAKQRVPKASPNLQLRKPLITPAERVRMLKEKEEGEATPNHERNDTHTMTQGVSRHKEEEPHKTKEKHTPLKEASTNSLQVRHCEQQSTSNQVLEQKESQTSRHIQQTEDKFEPVSSHEKVSKKRKKSRRKDPSRSSKERCGKNIDQSVKSTTTGDKETQLLESGYNDAVCDVSIESTSSQAAVDQSGLTSQIEANQSGTVPHLEANQSGTVSHLEANQSGSVLHLEANQSGTVSHLEANQSGTVSHAANQATSVSHSKVDQPRIIPKIAAMPKKTTFKRRISRANPKIEKKSSGDVSGKVNAETSIPFENDMNLDTSMTEGFEVQNVLGRLHQESPKESISNSKSEHHNNRDSSSKVIPQTSQSQTTSQHVTMETGGREDGLQLKRHKVPPDGTTVRQIFRPAKVQVILVFFRLFFG